MDRKVVRERERKMIDQKEDDVEWRVQTWFPSRSKRQKKNHSALTSAPSDDKHQSRDKSSPIKNEYYILSYFYYNVPITISQMQWIEFIDGTPLSV